MNSSEFFSEQARKWRLATANGPDGAAAEAGTPAPAENRANAGAVRLPKGGGDAARAEMAATGMPTRAPTAMTPADPGRPYPRQRPKPRKWTLATVNGGAMRRRTPERRVLVRDRATHGAVRVQSGDGNATNGLVRGGRAAITCAGGRVGGRAGSGHTPAPADAAQMDSRDGRSRHATGPNMNSGGLEGMGRPVWPEASEQADRGSRHALRRPCDTFGDGGPQTRSSVR